MTGWIGISLGDVTGIGPEVTLKALASEADRDDFRYLIIGDLAVLQRQKEQLGVRLDLVKFLEPAWQGRPAGGLGQDAQATVAGRTHDHELPGNPRASAPALSDQVRLKPAPGDEPNVFVRQGGAETLPEALTPGCPTAATASVHWLTEGARLCLQGELDALVTAPVNKAAIIRAGHAFVGQTEFLTQLAKASDTAMMLLGQDDRGRWLRVVLATTHLPIKNVADHLDTQKITVAIERAAQACHDLGLNTARVAVCGLNPHAGEDGELGDEEIRILTPAIHAARQRGLDVTGPVAADTLFHRAYRGEFDVVVAMYHDQGLGPLKMIAFATGVNWTLGLPFIRTSPDHGTAYDIAGNGVANPSSMVAAIRLAKQLARRRE